MTDILIAPRGAHPADPQATQPTSVPQPEPGPGRRHRLVRFGVLAVAVAALAAAAALLPLQAIAHSVLALGPIAAVAIAILGGFLLSVLVPRTAITMACGALLGPATGSVTALAAAVLAAVATYYLGRWAGRGFLGARAGSKMAQLDGWLNRRGLSAVLLVRFLPLAPYGLVGYAYGTTSVCRKRYLLGTTLAAVPSTISYAVLGAAVTAPGKMNALTLTPAIIGFALTGAIVLRWRLANRRQAAATAALATAAPA
ncbi:putative membrane protein YdjX (TVP38/TMEM64 family) [Krasilnikovia cinnamomea]|uniref:TVP38/TMEM64 family membrane protein n=1 Tax=Krasilnikovia cinnamomea TaxID=349313 RepID=A0A4Q7ZQB4_9ACTN|nr:VTT domain-containing protein [Krasilnikovia cinnamomea]RZU52944.1 putative membrane protein YdjX (TVP38/TMEM64 family) [Krasilnikovia cinnamomea]